MSLVISDVVSAVEQLQSDYAAATTTLAALLVTDSQTHRDLKGFGAACVGFRGKIREIRALIDPYDAVDTLSVVDGRRTILLWTWQRSLRAQLAQLDAAVIDLERQAAEMISGVDRRTVVVRDGETWQSIAARELGDWREWSRLVAANPDQPATKPERSATILIPQKR